MRMTPYAVAIASIAAISSLIPTAVANAARPSPPSTMTTNCDYVGTGYPRWATAAGTPKGTKYVGFTFWNTAEAYQSNNSYGNTNVGTDSDGRDGWAMFSDYPSAVVVATAYNGKGTALANAVDYCILAG
jgi:hypothetical protein